MSTSLKVVSIAAVCCASTRRLAIVARRLDMRHAVFAAVRSVRGAGGAGASWPELAPAGAACRRRRRLAERLPGFACRPSVTSRHRPCVTRGPSDCHRRQLDVSARAPPRRADGVAGAAVAARSVQASPAPRRDRGSPAAGGRRLRGRTPATLAEPVASSIVPSTSPIFTSAPSACAIVLEHAVLRRGDLDVDLVRLELDERLAHRDGVAFLLQPARDAGVDDRLAHLRHDDVAAMQS